MFTHNQSKKQFQKTMRLNNLNTILSSEINLLSIRQREASKVEICMQNIERYIEVKTSLGS